MSKKGSGKKFGSGPVITGKNSNTRNSVLSEIEKTDATHNLSRVRRTDGTDVKITNRVVTVVTAGNSIPRDGPPPRILPITTERKKQPTKDLKKKATQVLTFHTGDTESEEDHDADTVRKAFASTNAPRNVQGRGRK